MNYPQFLRKGMCIGLVAPSFGCTIDPYQARLKSAISVFKDNGFLIKEGCNIYSEGSLASASKEKRAQEFMDMYLDPTVDFIVSVGGGERMIEILNYIDFSILKKAPPKYFMGYSDNTVLTFTLTINCDIPSFFYAHAPEFGRIPWEDELKNGFSLIKGEKQKQYAYNAYELEKDSLQENPLLPHIKNGRVEWNTADGEDAHITGRFIGGTLDVLQLMCGTPFASLGDFQNRYKDDGFIWYLESCELHALATLRALWQLKNNGWFSYVKGFVFGIPLMGDDVMGLSYQDAVISVLHDLKVPIIFNANFGHMAPTIPIFNGFLGEVVCSKKESFIRYFKGNETI